MWKCKEWWNIQLTLGIWCGPLSQHPLPPARHQPHLLIPSAQTNSQKKQREPRNEIQLPTNPIVLPWSTYTEPRGHHGRRFTKQQLNDLLPLEDDKKVKKGKGIKIFNSKQTIINQTLLAKIKVVHNSNKLKTNKQ